jgi:AcrR family transcriptional regulator
MSTATGSIVLPSAAPIARAAGSVDERIFASTLELLRGRGPLAVSVEAVAAASGVAKTTIYRRYENRDELLRAAVRSAATAVDIPGDLSTKDTLRWVLRHARDTIEHVVGRGTVAAVLANEDPQFTSLLLEMIRNTTRPFRENLRERSLAGELPPGIDIELAMSVLLGAVVAELIRGRVTDDAWVESVLDLLWPAFEVR